MTRARRTILFAASAAMLGACESNTRGAAVKVTIPPGASLRTAAESLHKAGLVASPRFFRYYVKATGDDHDIKAGTYSLRSGESWKQLITALRDGEGLERKLTIPEGWSLFNIVPALANTLGPALYGVRLDTSEMLVDQSVIPLMGRTKPTGVTPQLVHNVRDALDQAGHSHVRIVVSGGFTVEKIHQFERLSVPVDAYGVGSSLFQGRFDFTADGVMQEGRPCAKVGREYRPSTRLERVE